MTADIIHFPDRKAFAAMDKLNALARRQKEEVYSETMLLTEKEHERVRTYRECLLLMKAYWDAAAKAYVQTGDMVGLKHCNQMRAWFEHTRIEMEQRAQ